MSQTFNPSWGENEVGAADFSFSFVANNTSDPNAELIRGKKVATITKSSADGKYIVTLSDGYYQINTISADVFADSGADGAYATVYVPDEAASPLVLHVFTHDANGTDTNLTSRRVCVNMKLKLSVGT